MSDWSYENQPDYEKAESLYRKALAIPNNDEQETIQKRMGDMLDEKAHPQKREEIWNNRQNIKQKRQQKAMYKVGASVKVKEDRVYSELSSQYGYAHLGEEGIRIQKVLEGVDSQSEWKAFRAWESYLKTKLKIPFDAQVSESQDYGHLRQGDKVQVTQMLGVVEMYGIIAELRYQKQKHQFPLCDLEALNKKSSNYQSLKDYCIWFANR